MTAGIFAWEGLTRQFKGNLGAFDANVDAVEAEADQGPSTGLVRLRRRVVVYEKLVADAARLLGEAEGKPVKVTPTENLKLGSRIARLESRMNSLIGRIAKYLADE